MSQYLSSWTRNPSDDALAKETLETLFEFYPGHNWHVKVDGGVLQIKNLSFSGKWGMVRKLKDILYDATARKRSIIWAAGEFLERAKLKRGPWNGDRAARVEGIPQKDLGR